MSTMASSSMHPLVTQPLVDTKKFFCPFLTRGFCRESSRCNFSHDSCASIKIPHDFCHFYLANQCLYGQDCKFRHTEPSAPTSSTNTTNTNAATNTTTSNINDDPITSDYYDQHDIFESYINNNNSAQPYLMSSSDLNRHLPIDDQAYDVISSRLSSSLPSIPIASSSRTHRISDQSDDGGCKEVVYGDEETMNHSEDQEARACSLTSYAKVCRGKTTTHAGKTSNNNPKKDYPLCPYSITSGECPFPIGQCSYLHGLDCDLCGRPCLHPYNMDQQRQHRDECLREHEREMELSFAVQRSKDKVCGICMDTVVEKKPITSSRFGILEKCNHIFCLDCIRKWRGTKQFETRTIRACPECRVSSDFVVPSKYWVEDQDDKEKLIHDYKAALRSKPCKYFNEGKGECPFAGCCFYKHAYPDGRIAKMETPKPRRRVYGAHGQTSTVTNYILWNLLTSTDEDDWSNDELESLYLDHADFGTTDDEDVRDDDIDAALW